MIMHCIALAFSQYFIHLDVCLFIENCVLLGLDWVEPIMQFLLACHMLMHISCICTFSFPSLYSLMIVWSVFSLSLSDRLCMTPKHKSTPTRNPFRFGSSSSSDPIVPLLHVRFSDEKAHQDFSKNFSKRGVHPERHVILLNFSNIPLPNVIHTRGWESLCEIPLRCPTMFIQEFYSNMHDIDTFVPQFVTTFRGTCITVTPDLISKILHVPWVSHSDYPIC